MAHPCSGERTETQKDRYIDPTRLAVHYNIQKCYNICCYGSITIECLSIVHSIEHLYTHTFGTVAGNLKEYLSLRWDSEQLADWEGQEV